MAPRIMRGSNFTPTMGTLLMILLYSMLIGETAVAPALPLIKQVFPGQDTLVSMIVTILSLAIALVGFAIGFLADRLGKARVLGVSLTVFVDASASSFLIDDLYMLLAVRFIIGIGIVGITNTVTALIVEYYLGIDRVKVFRYQSAARVWMSSSYSTPVARSPRYPEGSCSSSISSESRSC